MDAKSVLLFLGAPQYLLQATDDRRTEFSNLRKCVHKVHNVQGKGGDCKQDKKGGSCYDVLQDTEYFKA